jgi:glycosyltransferase involved in cell wall biosynthesis
MKICFVCGEYPPGPHGGIGTFVQVLARGLAAAGHEIRVIGSYNASYPAADYEDDQGVRVWRQRYPAHRFGWIQARYTLYQTVARWARLGEIDLVSVPDYQGLAAGWPALPIPVGVRLHGSSTYFALEMNERPNRIARWLERRSLARADYWCSVSRYTAERTAAIFQLSKPCSAVLYNPVELPTLDSQVVRSPHDIVFTGTLAEKKGVIPLLQSWPAVVLEHPQARLHVYGKDGRYRGSSMQAHLLSLLPPEVVPSVTFHGHQPRSTIFAALTTARAAVFPSYAEAFAIAPLEAMAHGCPTIYSLRGSGPELIRQEQDGLLIDPDHPADLSAALLRVLRDNTLAERLGRAGRARIEERFTLRTIIPENEAFYQERIEQFQSRRLQRSGGRSAASL